MTETRVIKKYPNRRLYDTRDSRYITLSDIRRLVLEERGFTVIDKKSGSDITHTILLQVIGEQERHGPSVLSEGFLTRVIRASNEGAPDLLRDYLEQSLELFVAEQRHAAEATRVLTRTPVRSAT